MTDHASAGGSGPASASSGPRLRLDEATLARLRGAAEACGLLRLGVARLDDPAFEPARAALDAHLDAGHHGDMEFMARTRSVRKDPAQMLSSAQSVLVALVPYRGEAGPVARYAQSADYHTQLHRRWLEFLPALQAELPGVEHLICVDTKPLLERAAAAIAGLGFLGKSGLLIAPGLGSFVLLGAMLISAAYVGEDPAPAWVRERSSPWQACGSCRRCLDACPTDAFVEPGVLDARRCISYLTIEARGPVPKDLQAKIGERLAGCDVCQEVCPYNHAPAQSRERRVPTDAWLPLPPGRDRSVDTARLVELVNVGNNQHRGFVKHTALNRIPRRALRRNAAIALGNADGHGADARAALERAAASEDEVLKETALTALELREAKAVSK